MRDVRADFETEPAEFNGESSHVHLLVNFPPKAALSRLVNSLKGVSPRRTPQESPDPRRHYRPANRLRSGPYLAGSAGGTPISVVLRQYIEQQNRPFNHGRGPAPFTTGLKAGALGTDLVAAKARSTASAKSAIELNSRL
jgi:putative transposase